MISRRCFYLGLFLFVALVSFGQSTKTHWVDSIMDKMPLNEKVGQLMMIPASSYYTRQEQLALETFIRTYHPGGLYIIRGGPVSHINLINKVQSLSKVPLLVGMNAEWGPGQTLDSIKLLPKPLLLGAIHNDSLVNALAIEISLQMKSLGVQVNFAPHADIDVPRHSANLQLRYFGDNKRKVAATSVAYMKGIQQNGSLAVAKHIAGPPGSIPEVHELKDAPEYFEINGIDTLSFYPYRKLIDEGVGGILTTYLHISRREDKKAVPASVSEIFISDILKKRLGFEGLAFTEIPYLKAIVRKRKGEAEKLAFVVGHDVLIAPQHTKKAVKKIVKAVLKDTALMDQLNSSVRKILSAKYNAGLARRKEIEWHEVNNALNSPGSKLITQLIEESAATLVVNSKGSLPIQSIAEEKFVMLAFGKNSGSLEIFLNKYAAFNSFNITSWQDTTRVAESLLQASHIIAAIFPDQSFSAAAQATYLKKIARAKNITVCYFGNVFELQQFSGLPAIVVGYDESATARVVAEIIFGARQPKGKMPVTSSGEFPEGNGVTFSPLGRLSRSVPEAVGMDSRTLGKIEAIAQEAIEEGATPGCHVLVCRNGKLVYEKSFGWLTYEKKTPVDENTIYDLASVTKISATLQAVMFMHQNGFIDINKKASVYLPELRDSNKKDFTIRDILTHQAGLWPFLPFWMQTINDPVRAGFYNDSATENFPFPVAEKLFARISMKDSLWQWIIKSKIVEKKDRTPYDYRYSDMGFYILQHLAEKILSQPMEEFLGQKLYGPLGATTTGYLPLRIFPSTRIAPTENDMSFRKSLLTGYVHDQGAAMHGGIAGHAGLFSSANDLAKLGQLWLQQGSYGGTQFFQPETIRLFTSYQFETSSRGLGWNKPVPGDWNTPTSVFASPATFGHTGFTGTCIWVDPEFNLVYIFLSNRVHPDMNNNKLLQANIRTRIQDVIYQAIFKYCESH